MDNLKIGQLIEGEQHKDAIHVAVAPVVATIRLNPGQHVGLTAAGVNFNSPIGIVDPFLTGTVMPGQRFWLFLYPGSITSLRHEWEHPAFNVEPAEASSEAWLRAYANEVGISYTMLMEQHAGDNEGWMPKEEFWTHHAIVTGKVTPEDERYFSCSC